MIDFLKWLFKGEMRVTKLSSYDRTMYLIFQGTCKDDKEWAKKL